LEVSCGCTILVRDNYVRWQGNGNPAEPIEDEKAALQDSSEDEEEIDWK